MLLLFYVLFLFSDTISLVINFCFEQTRHSKQRVAKQSPCYIFSSELYQRMKIEFLQINIYNYASQKANHITVKKHIYI